MDGAIEKCKSGTAGSYALMNEAANGELMPYDATPNWILEHQTQGKASHTMALISVVNEKNMSVFYRHILIPSDVLPPQYQ